jgi:formylglycine-generating enzyme
MVGLSAFAAIGLGLQCRTLRENRVACAPGFHVFGHRCCVSSEPSKVGQCEPTTKTVNANCPAPLARRSGLCLPPDLRVRVPSAAFEFDRADWEAADQTKPRRVEVKAFELDAFEATRFDIAYYMHISNHEPNMNPPVIPADAGQAATLSFEEARAHCQRKGGRIPSEDEWLVAARAKEYRYPWGPTGAVCRRAAWGLADGPCSHGARGPDTVGAHESSDRAFWDLAGNVAEWTTSADGPRAKGGSFASAFAAELRSWASSKEAIVVDSTRVLTTGVRCAYNAE